MKAKLHKYYTIPSFWHCFDSFWGYFKHSSEFRDRTATKVGNKEMVQEIKIFLLIILTQSHSSQLKDISTNDVLKKCLSLLVDKGIQKLVFRCKLYQILFRAWITLLISTSTHDLKVKKLNKSQSYQANENWNQNTEMKFISVYIELNFIETQNYFPILVVLYNLHKLPTVLCLSFIFYEIQSIVTY